MFGFAILAAAGVVIIVRQINRSLRQVVGERLPGPSKRSAAAQVASSTQSLAQLASEQAASLEENLGFRGRDQLHGWQEQREFHGSGQSGYTIAREVRRDQSLATADGSGHGRNQRLQYKISKIIKVIDEMAFQTNILALNAGVEAAGRRGRHGLRGGG